MRDSVLMSVTVVEDSETGQDDVGDLDYSIPVQRLTQYLRAYGPYGAEAIKKQLDFLKTKVDEYLVAAEKEPNEQGL